MFNLKVVFSPLRRTAEFFIATAIAYTSVFCSGNAKMEVDNQKGAPTIPVTTPAVPNIYQTLTLNNTYQDLQICLPGQKVILDTNLLVGKVYEFFWNDSYAGNNTKDLDVYVRITNASGTTVYATLDSAYNAPLTFYPPTSGTYRLEVIAFYANQTGTFAIKGREKLVLTTQNLSLTADGNYVSDTLDAENNTRDIYSLAVTSGEVIFINWNDIYGGDNTQTANILVMFMRPDNSIISLNHDVAYSSPVQITADFTGNLKIIVDTYSNTSLSVTPRTYQIKATKPQINNYPTTLSSSWINGSLSLTNPQNNYLVSLTAGQSIDVFTNDLLNGDNAQTGDTLITIEDPNQNIIVNQTDSAYTTPVRFTASITGSYKIKITKKISGPYGTYQIKAMNTPVYIPLENSMNSRLTTITNINSMAQGSNNYVITQALLDEITAFNANVAQIDTSFPNFLTLMDKANEFMLKLNGYFYSVEQQAGGVVSQIDTLYPSILAALPLAAQQAYLDHIKNTIAAQVSYPTDAEASALNNKLYLWNTFGNIYSQNLFYNVNKVSTENMINDLLNNATGNSYTDSFVLNSLVAPSLPYLNAAQANLATQKLLQAFNQYASLSYQSGFTANALLYSQISNTLGNLGTAVAFVTDGALQDQIIAAATAKIFNNASQTNGTGELNMNRRMNYLSTLIGVGIKNNAKSSAALATMIGSFNFGSLAMSESTFTSSFSIINSASNTGSENHPLVANLMLMYVNILKNMNQFNGLAASDQNAINQFLTDGENWLKSINPSWTLTNNLLTQSGFISFGPRINQQFVNIRQ